MDELYDDLAHFGEEVPFQEDAPPPTCDGMEQANRLLARIGLNHRRQHEIVGVHEAEQRRLDDWLEDRLSCLEEEARWLRSGVEQFLRAHHAAGGGVTVKLPNGELKLRPSQLSLVTDDAEAFVAWATEKEHRDLVRVPDPPAPRPDAKAVKALVGDALNIVEAARTDDGRLVFRLVDADGEVVPGVTFTRDAEVRTFTLTLAAADPVTPPADTRP